MTKCVLIFSQNHLKVNCKCKAFILSSMPKHLSKIIIPNANSSEFIQVRRQLHKHCLTLDSFKALLNAQPIIRTQTITLLQRELRPKVKKNEQQRKKKTGCGCGTYKNHFPSSSFTLVLWLQMAYLYSICNTFLIHPFPNPLVCLVFSYCTQGILKDLYSLCLECVI